MAVAGSVTSLRGLPYSVYSLKVVYLELWQVRNKDPGTRNMQGACVRRVPASTCTSSGKKGVNDAINPIPPHPAMISRLYAPPWSPAYAHISSFCPEKEVPSRPLRNFTSAFPEIALVRTMYRVGN
jgi:hypothetical protein